jgi:NADPH2:quinone reductase
MRAAWYEQQGPAREVLRVGEIADPLPAADEVRIGIAASGINPGDIKKRQNAFGYGMPYPSVIPHSDGAGHVDRVGEGVTTDWIGRRVWCDGAQSYRAFGTAAEYAVVPASQVVPPPDNVSFEQGACLGIPGITAHRCVHAAGPVEGRTVLVQGGAGAVGICALQLANRAGATVIAAVRATSHEAIARKAGAHHVVHGPDLTQQVRARWLRMASTTSSKSHSGANIAPDLEMLAIRGSIATYATDGDTPSIPFSALLFKNIRVDFLGSDDFTAADKVEAARAINDALIAGWRGFEIAERFPLAEIATAHERLEATRQRGRVVLLLS